jgi:signal transduction histidine kinase
MPDGQAKYVHSEGQPFLDRDGNLTKMFGIAQDVTNMHHLDDAKREFVSLASHQLRTPASGVKAFLSLLIDGYAGTLTRKQHQFVKKAYEANDRQLDIIDNLLSLASIESGKLVLNREPVNLNDIIRACLPHHRLEIREKKQKLSTHLPKKPLIIKGDASHLQMAVDNLISNAIKYTPEKGVITVSSHMDEHAAYLDVIDSGIGIAKADIPSLFQKFSRLSISTSTSGTVGGTGLGLYLAKYIIKLHRGTISVKSRRGEGAQFRIKLPLAKK